MRYRRVRVSGQFLTMLFVVDKVFHGKCVQGLPEGTRFAYAIPSTDYSIWIVVEHESFLDLQDGDVIPEHGSVMFNHE